MQCKNHPNRKAEQFCTNCGIPLCADCSEEIGPGEHYCFECAMIQSVSQIGTSLIDKRQQATEKKLKKKIKWGPFHYFVVAAAALILVMWGVILFGGQKPPARAVNIAGNERAFLFMVDSAIKRYAHYEGNRYPEKLSQLIPKYLPLGEGQTHYLARLSYQTDPSAGYRLTLLNPKEGEMKIIISPEGIEYEIPPSEGA